MFSRFFKQRQPSEILGSTSEYLQLGGASGVLAMAQRFYDIMATDPEVQDLLALHPQPLSGSQQKLYEFLSGWFGGPQLFTEKYGHPRLRARHLPFAIDTNMRDQWLHCMYQVLDEQVTEPLLHQRLRTKFTRLAHHMINTGNPA